MEITEKEAGLIRLERRFVGQNYRYFNGQKLLGTGASGQWTGPHWSRDPAGPIHPELITIFLYVVVNVEKTPSLAISIASFFEFFFEFGANLLLFSAREQ